jgi:hypothetical protein
LRSFGPSLGCVNKKTLKNGCSFVREGWREYIFRTVIAIIAIITLKNSSVNGVIQKLAGGRVVNFVFIATSFFIETIERRDNTQT